MSSRRDSAPIGDQAGSSTIDVELTPAGAREYETSLELYAQTLLAQARAYAEAKEVTRSHIEQASRALSPSYEVEGPKVVLDWIKRAGFLLVGLAIAQTFSAVAALQKGTLTTENLVLVIVLLLISAVLLVSALAVDIPKFLTWTAAQRLKKEIRSGQRRPRPVEVAPQGSPEPTLP